MPTPDRGRRSAGRRRAMVGAALGVALGVSLGVAAVVVEGARVLAVRDAAPGPGTAPASSAGDPGPPVPVLVLGGDRARVERALGLTGVADGARPLVASADAGRDLVALGGDCDAPGVRCVEPVPATTRGEALLAARLAGAEGWDRLVVVTSWWHVHRAGLHLAACLDPLGVRVTMVPAGSPSGPPGAWRLLREAVGAVDARLRPECGDARP